MGTKMEVESQDRHRCLRNCIPGDCSPGWNGGSGVMGREKNTTGLA